MQPPYMEWTKTMMKSWRCQLLENQPIEVDNTICGKNKPPCNSCYIILGAVVSVEKFDSHVKKMHSDRDQFFENEYAVSYIVIKYSE